MTTLTLVLTAAPAQAVVQATGAFSRNADGTTLNLRVTNTSTASETINSVEIQLSAAGYSIASATGPGGACSSTGGTFGFYLCGNATIPAGGFADFTVTPTPAPYPEAGGGRINVYSGAPLFGPFTVTGPEALPVTPVPEPTPTPAQTPTPVQDQSELLEPVSGIVLIRPPGQKQFTRLLAGALIKDGTEVGVKQGVARITVNANGVLKSAEIALGRVLVDQMGALTQLKLSEKLACPKASKRARTSKRPKKRRIFIKSRDNFQSRGNHAAGTVRGTQWTTTDTCDATTIKVTEGTVSVRDFRKRKTVAVTAPKSYTARPEND